MPPVNIDVIVTAPRVDIPLKEMPAATSVVSPAVLSAMPRAIAAEEALRPVPGVKVDNQADGERVHISIRGQGLLTERGIRGIKVLLDGLPLNDPTGFAPDLFDVDWSSVNRVEVVRGPASALYGGGAAGGVINIETRDGAATGATGSGSVNVGSYDFWKAYAEAGGTAGTANYRVSLSHNSGDGYRDHTAFHATNLYGKVRWNASPAFTLSLIGAGTGYFNQNAEGLNLEWLAEDRRMANPDAITYNEYQDTKRGTGGAAGTVQITPSQQLSFSAYYRHTGWVESVPSSVQHRQYDSPGAIVQYALQHGTGRVKNQFIAGGDFEWQAIDDYRVANLGGAQEGPDKLSDQTIDQRSAGLWLLDRMTLGSRWNVLLDVRSDNIHNALTDLLKANGVDLSGEKDFDKVTGRIGGSWTASERFGIYASVGQGFLPPATEELANNPYQLGGFNMSLVPATSVGEDVGIRGLLAGRLAYDLTYFHLDTKNDFGRFRVPWRPLETFYTNAGASRRNGIESALTWRSSAGFTARMAYTFSDFKYTNIKSVFGTFTDKVMPNAPRHQIFADAEYLAGSHWIFGLAIQGQSSWYVDQTNTASADGFVLLDPRIVFRLNGRASHTEIILQARNVLGTEYIAFTEPDPDGNSYQPGPTAEVFLGARVYLGK